MKYWLSSTLIACAAIIFTTSCNKNDKSGEGKAKFQVYLTDAPASYDEVLIDVKDVMINYSGDSSNGWQSLGQVYPGTYDILKLVNDQDTVLADAEIQTGKIEQIRLVLGPNNYVRVGGQLIPLQTPSAQQSGLKLNVHQDVQEGMLYKLTLDFDASRSIVKTGNGKYILKPVIRTALEAVGGSIKGSVSPGNIPSAVYAIQGSDTLAGTTTSNGQYFIKGLAAGSYTVGFRPSDYPTHQMDSLLNVPVTTGNVTTAATLTLH